jgi:hypothetical protein
VAIKCFDSETAIYTGTGGPNFPGSGFKASDTPTPIKFYATTLSSMSIRGNLIAAWYQVEEGFSSLSAFDTILVTLDVNNPTQQFNIGLSASIPLQNVTVTIRVYALYDDS